MTVSNCSREGLVAAALVAALAGCGGGETSQASSPIANVPFASPMAGGTFMADNSGNFSLVPCVKNYYPPPGHDGDFTFSGRGTTSFIGPSTEKGNLVMYHASPYDCWGKWTGTDTLTSARNPRNSIFLSVTSGGSSKYGPCGPFGRIYDASFTVTGGTGRFSHATGSGTGGCEYQKGPQYNWIWKGTVNY